MVGISFALALGFLLVGLGLGRCLQRHSVLAQEGSDLDVLFSGQPEVLLLGSAATAAGVIDLVARYCPPMVQDSPVPAWIARRPNLGSGQ